MKPKLYFAILAALLCISALAIPFPYGPAQLRGGVAPALGAPSRCFALRYDSTTGEPLPAQVRLRAERGWTDGYFAADGGPGELREYRFANWRPAGRDSIDIFWHHSPVVRIPSSGDRVIGRVIPAGYAPLIGQFGLDMRGTRAFAQVMSCSEYGAKSS